MRDGTLLHDLSAIEPSERLNEAYVRMGLNYPKFHKMDPQSRLGLLATEALLANTGVRERHAPDRIGVVLHNADASLDTDLRYAAGVHSTPSPSLFVYTLPNVVVGEVCIKNNFKGHNAFFIFEAYEPGFLHAHVREVLLSGMADACLCGWTEVLGDRQEALLFLVERTAQGKAIPFTPAGLAQKF